MTANCEIYALPLDHSFGTLSHNPKIGVKIGVKNRCQARILPISLRDPHQENLLKWVKPQPDTYFFKMGETPA